MWPYLLCKGDGPVVCVINGPFEMGRKPFENGMTEDDMLVDL